MATYDVIIIGAGVSGINAAYRIKTAFPDASYCLIEARGQVGGTWDFFKYPGIRSDSDLLTFGFPWRPWVQENAIASGAHIAQYIKDSAAEQGIDKKTFFHHRLLQSEWSTPKQTWTCMVDNDGKKKQFTGKFLFLASGYYDYEKPLDVVIPGIDQFKGKIVHPQFWPEKLDYDNKRIVIIGSGATAVTLLPNLTDRAAHVTMLQRSPGYIVSEPAIDPVDAFLKQWLPLSLAAKLSRYQFLVLPWLFYQFCRLFPTTARNFLRKQTEPMLPVTLPHNPHFEPTYNPWEERLCMCPDGDFYKALREGKGNVVTQTIKTVTESGITLNNGETLPADIIVTATGLRLRLAGGSTIIVDGEIISVNEKFLWKGAMLQDVPNSALVIGYINASWTLGADATAQLVTRLIKTLRKKGMSSCVPRMSKLPKEVPLLQLNSTYVKSSTVLPRAGDSGPWKPRSNYFQDYYTANYGNITEQLEFVR